MGISGIGIGTTAPGGAGANKEKDTNPYSFASVLAENTADGQKRALAKPQTSEGAQKFLDFMQKTPAQRQWAAFLASQGLTEEEFKALSPKEQEKLLAKLREMIEQQTKNTINEYQKQTGGIFA